MRPNWFIGFPVDLTEWFLTLDGTPRGTRYCDSADLHVPFSFLGPVEEVDAMAAWEVARKLKAGPFYFQPGSMESFGPQKRPTAWGLSPKGPMHDLATFMVIHRNDVARAARARPDSRPPRPHIALARPRRLSSDAERANLESWAKCQQLPQEPIELNTLALYTWSEDIDDRLFRIVEQQRISPIPREPSILDSVVEDTVAEDTVAEDTVAEDTVREDEDSRSGETATTDETPES